MKYPYTRAGLERGPIIVIVVFALVWIYNSYKTGKFRK